MKKKETQQLIGTILDETAERDAIHIAVIPVVCGEDYMGPGDEFGLKFGTKNVAMSQRSVYDEHPVGVIDPFLRKHPRKGDIVYGFLYPNSVTGMRHHWFHPVFDEPAQAKNAHEAWLRNFAEKWHFNYNEMIEAATTKDGGDWNSVTARGKDIHDKSELDMGDYELFWEHIEALAGEKFDNEHREKLYWSCSC